MTGRLKDKVAVITGGSSGIGLATAQRFVEEGAQVYIMGRRQIELDKAAAAIGRNVNTVQGDVGNVADLERLYAQVKKEKGAVHVVVASAGIAEVVPTEAATTEHFDRLFNTNLRGLFFTVQKALPLMGKGASVVLVASGVHMKGVPGYATYSATKAGVRSLARTWANEWKDRGIRVNTLSPGPVDTPIFELQFGTKEQADGARAMMAGMVPIGRLARPEEMAAAALFLASDESSYSTGVDLVADGGFSQV